MVVENPVVITEKELFELAKQARGRITAIYLHWTAGHYGQVFDDYHLCIDQDGTVYATCDDLCERKAHTWMRNNGTGPRRIPGSVSGHGGWGNGTAHGDSDRSTGQDRGHSLQDSSDSQQFRTGDDPLRSCFP